MSLGQLNFDGKNKVDVAIERLKMYEPESGYYLAFSGGKDSICIKALADMAGVKYDAHYNLTTVDPPELVRFIKDVHPDVKIEKPDMTMWKLIKKNRVLPTRKMRYCCAALKESKGAGRLTVTGVRWAESGNRKDNQGLITVMDKRFAPDNVNFYQTIRGGVVLNNDNSESRRLVEICSRTSKTIINPIVDWHTDDVWELIKVEELPYPTLYDDGFKRLGCIGCPNSGNRINDFIRWPTYYRRYMACIQWLIDNGHEKRYKTKEEVMRWWLELKPWEHVEELGL